MLVATEEVAQRDGKSLNTFSILCGYIFHELGKLIATTGVDEESVSLEVKVRLSWRIWCSKCQLIVVLHSKSLKLVVHKEEPLLVVGVDEAVICKMFIFTFMLPNYTNVILFLFQDK